MRFFLFIVLILSCLRILIVFVLLFDFCCFLVCLCVWFRFLVVLGLIV